MRGWVRVVPFNDPRRSLLPRLSTWWLRGAEGVRAVRIESAKAHGADEIVAQIDGVDDREAALALVGFEVLLSRAQFPAPGDDEVYWADLIGCTVLDPDGESLGVVVAIEDQPAHPLMRVVDPDRQPPRPGEARPDDARPDDARPPEERLIPLVPEFLLSIDLAGRVVVADWRRDY